MSATYTIPGTFFEDHMSRFYGEGPWQGHDRDTEIWTRKGVTISMTDEQASELLADAKFYVSMGVSEFGPEYLGLISSARATVKSLTRQMQGSS